MTKLVERLQQQYQQLIFTAGRQYSWSPETNEIFYTETNGDEESDWSLLHETGHALLGHYTYYADIELLKLEVAAWQRARQLAADFGTTIDEDHIQDCLDTYRDWLYKRSICPGCSAKCLQQNDFVHYRCFNCHKVWRVSASRFCRSYRSTKNVPQVTTFYLESEL